MFKINIYLKFALIAIFLFGGIILGFMYGFGYSWIMILIGVIILVSYIMLGTIQSAAEMKGLSLSFMPAEGEAWPRFLEGVAWALGYFGLPHVLRRRGHSNHQTRNQ